MIVIGLDCGLTVTKAVVFDSDGTALAAGRRSPRRSPHPHHVERDPDALWDTCTAAIREALAACGRAAGEVAAIGVTGHGDGLYLAAADGSAPRPGISSLDSRAADIAARWRRDGTAAQALALTGQEPNATSPVTLLRWLADHEPDVLAASRWLLSCKDWVRMRLTGRAATDPTEASTSFTNVATQRYDPAVLALFGLSAYEHLLPPVSGCAEPAGKLTRAAAEVCGLRPGTPVVTGLHDVDASAIGSGCVRPGQLSVIAGTYSVNQVIADRPHTDPRWFARNFATPDHWMHMSISPASATNLEWFLAELAPDVLASGDPYGRLAAAYAEVAEEESSVLFLPYLYGGPAGVDADAAFVGIRGWHRRAHLLRAVLEGVVFNHRRHVDALREVFAIDEVRLTGGASRAPHWARLFADAFGLPVRVVRTEETGALGAALCALVGAGAHPDLASAARAVPDDAQVVEPTPGGSAELDVAYRRFLRVSAALSHDALAA